jgi:CBS domain-containing protein
MNVNECMTRDVKTVGPEQTLAQAAQLMAELDCGALPVAEQDRLVGMVTDRDIVIRGVAAGRGPDTPVSEVMSTEVLYCFADQSLDEVTRNMGDERVRRLPVLSRDKRLVGIISLGDIAQDGDSDGLSAAALRRISQNGGEHSTQTN